MLTPANENKVILFLHKGRNGRRALDLLEISTELEAIPHFDETHI